MITVINASAAVTLLQQSLKFFSGLCSSSVTAALALMTVITQLLLWDKLPSSVLLMVGHKVGLRCIHSMYVHNPKRMPQLQVFPVRVHMNVVPRSTGNTNNGTEN